MTIFNKPEYANEYDYIVAIPDGDDYWFYGAYANESKAYRVALEIDGVVIKNNI